MARVRSSARVAFWCFCFLGTPLSVIHSEALHAATLATQVGGKPSRARTWATKEKAVTTAVTC